MEEDGCNNEMRPPPAPRKIVFRRCIRSANGQFVPTHITTHDEDHDRIHKAEMMDADSVRRRFGWISETLTIRLSHVVHLPYIFRRGEQFCSTRIFKLTIIDMKWHKVHENVYKFCTQATIDTHTVTVHEASLLNEINLFHCDAQYGHDKFTVADTIFRLDDARRFAEFVTACSQLAEGVLPPLPSKNFGLIHINKTGVVPYVVADVDGMTYVPACFFSDDHNLLRTHKTILGGWDVPFLKLAALIMNVGMDFLTEATCVVVNFNVVKTCFPVGTTFDHYWPVHEAVGRLVSNAKHNLDWLRVVPYVERSIKHQAPASGGGGGVDKDPLEIESSDFHNVNNAHQHQWRQSEERVASPPDLRAIDLPCDDPISVVKKPEVPRKTYLKRKP